MIARDAAEAISSSGLTAIAWRGAGQTNRVNEVLVGQTGHAGGEIGEVDSWPQGASQTISGRGRARLAVGITGETVRCAQVGPEDAGGAGGACDLTLCTGAGAKGANLRVVEEGACQAGYTGFQGCQVVVDYARRTEAGCCAIQTGGITREANCTTQVVAIFTDGTGGCRSGAFCARRGTRRTGRTG